MDALVFKTQEIEVTGFLDYNGLNRIDSDEVSAIDPSVLLDVSKALGPETVLTADPVFDIDVTKAIFEATNGIDQEPVFSVQKSIPEVQVSPDFLVSVNTTKGFDDTVNVTDNGFPTIDITKIVPEDLIPALTDIDIVFGIIKGGITSDFDIVEFDPVFGFQKSRSDVFGPATEVTIQKDLTKGTIALQTTATDIGINKVIQIPKSDTFNFTDLGGSIQNQDYIEYYFLEDYIGFSLNFT